MKQSDKRRNELAPRNRRSNAERAHRAGVAASVLALLASACDDSATVVNPAAPGDETPADGTTAPGGDDGTAGDAPSGSIYAMTVHAFGPDSTTSYLVSMPSLDAGNLMDLDTAIELPDFANVAGIPGQPYVWLGYSASPTIERWDLGANGQFTPGPTLSFANRGASSVSPDAQGAFISAELAAVPNQDTGELIFWNPTSMEIIGGLDLEIPPKDGIPPLVRSTIPRADGTLLLSYYYISAEGEFADGAGIVIVDPSAPAVIARDEWAGCNYNYMRETADGTIYLTVGAQWIQRRLVLPNGGPWLAEPCLLRILPGATQFDRDFDPNVLGGLAGRQITGNLEPLSDSQAFFVAWQEELMTEEFTVENFDDVAGSTAAFKWYLWDVGSATASEVPGAPFAALPTINTVDGRMLYADQRLVSDNGGLGVVPFYELTPEGSRAAFIGLGTTWSILRVR